MIPTWQKQQMQQQNMHDFYGNHFGGGPDSDKKRSYEQYQNATQYQPPFGNNNGQGVQQKRKDHKFVD